MKELMCDKKEEDGGQKPLDKLPSTDTLSGKKRRRRAARAKRHAVKPKKLFQEEEEEEKEDPPAQEQEDPSDNEDASSQGLHTEASEDEEAQDESDEDRDVFGGKFRYKTPKKAEKAKKKKIQVESAPTTKSTGSEPAMEATKSEAEVMAEIHTLSKRVEKRLQDCLPSNVNPFLSCE